MPIVIGLDTDIEWSTPDKLLGGAKPTSEPAKAGFGLDLESAASAKTESRSAPIDMPERDWNDMVNTVIAEAAGEGDEGMLAVASVIKNRAGVRGKSPGEIVREPDQFTGYAKPGPGALKAMRDPETRKRAESAIMRAFAGGEDPTGGADHYHATSVNPDWAGKMPQTAKVGQHLFYNSKANTRAPTTEAIGLTGEQPRSDAEVPFDALLGRDPETTSHVPNPEGKGLARLVRPEQKEDGSLLLSKLQPGKPTSYIENMKPELRTGLSAMFNDAPDHVKSGLDILSGARSPERQAEIIAVNAGKYGLDRNAWLADVAKLGPVEAGKKWRPQFKASGMSKNIGAPGGSRHQHGDAADLGWKGGRFADAPKEVREWVHANAERYGLSFPLGHEPWHIETASARGGKAGAPITKAEGLSGGIVIDENFTSSNPAFMQEAKAIGEQRAAAEAEAAAVAEREKIAARDQADNARIDAAQQALEQKEPGRYQVVDEAELPAWKQRWEEENRSDGVLGDLGRILGAGNARLGLATREAVAIIPGVGPTVVETLDAIDTWVTGKPTEQRLEEYAATADASVTPQQQEADAKKWWNEAKGTFGPAWSDPRSYLRGVGESAPGTVITMLPGGVLARATYLRMLAGGAEAATAAAAAAKTATIAGAVSEGMLGGAESSRSVRDRLAQIPREQLLQSEAVRDMLQGGMSEADAIKAVTEDAATQAFIVAGVTTGAFGGLGDRALAKILAEGVGGNVAQRVLRSAGRGAFAEGVLEELPQGVTQTMSENLAIKRVDPSQSITEGVEEAAAAGVATGGVMGGAMGGAGGAASPAAVDAETAADVNEPVPEPKGPLGRAVQHAQRKAEDRAVRTLPDVTAPAAAVAVPQDGRPEIGATVRVDAEGMDPMLARIESYQGDEAIVVDGGTGEVYQVPIANVSKIAESVDVQAEALRRAQAEPPVRDVLPELSSDPALEPAAPIAAETTTEIPPAREQKPATEKRPTRPQPGNRVIVEGSNGERFPARVESYEEDATEAVVVDDNGKPYQVPVEQLSVSGLTPDQVEQQELERNPPIEREPADAGPNSRRLGERTVVLPDERHAHLYDLAREQVIAKKLGGTSQVDMSKVLPAERKRLADAFGVSVEDLASMADDYRYRVERAAKEAKSALPVKMHPVNERLLKQRQTARAKQEPEAVAAKDEAGQWWDVELTAQARKRVLDEAGIKRNERVMWGNLTPNIQKKLIAVRDAERGTSGDETSEVVSTDPAPTTAADDAAHEAATSPSNDLPEPTQAQKEAGNYKVGRVRLGGMELSIENPAGSVRKGKSPSGKDWAVDMKSHYGYIRGTKGRDKDHIDIFVKPGTEALDDASPIFVVDQRDPARGRFDEHKVMAGYGSEEEARGAYLENYTSGWKGLGAISQTTLGEFKAWLESGKTEEPFAPKWFGSRDKAEAHLAKEKLGATHEVVENGKRFELREKKNAEAPTPVQQAATRETNAEPALHPRALFRSKEWKAAWSGSKFGQPHPESPVAYQMAKGWQDAKAGKEPQRRPVDGTKYRKDGHNPIDDYLMGYVAAREGKGREIRATEAERDFGRYLFDSVETPAPWEVEAEARANAAESLKATPNVAPRRDYTDTIRSLRQGVESWAETGGNPLIEGKLELAERLQALTEDEWAKVAPFFHRDMEPGVTLEPEKGMAAIDEALASTPAAERAPPEPNTHKRKSGNTLEQRLESAPEKVKAKLDDAFAKNKLFTADKVEAARARLRSKMSQVNSGLDPEVLIDGMTIAGAYIEAGVRDFSTYAKSMIDDLGESVTPYLLSFWEAARNYPGLDNSDMTSVEDSAAQFRELSKVIPESEKVAVGTIEPKPAKRAKKTGKSEDRTLVLDYGVDHIDAYSDEGEQVKEAFMKDAYGYLRAVSDVLSREGYVPFDDRKGRPRKPVNKSEGGIAVSGDVSLSMRNPETGASVYVSVGTGSLRGVVPSSPSGITLMYRADAGGKEYATGGTNTWPSPGLSVRELADSITSTAGRVVAADQRKASKGHVPAELDQSRPGALERAPAAEVRRAEEGRTTGSGADRSGGADVSGSGPARTAGLEAGRGVAAGQGDVSAAAAGDREEVAEGPFGPILRGYEGNWREAAIELERRQTGDAIGALSHPDVGPIDLVWGDEGTNQSNGTGLAKLIAWHPEVLQDLQGFIERLKVDPERSTTRRIQLEDETGRAGVRLDYDGTAKTWLLTAFEKGSRRTERSSRRLSDLWGDRNTASASPRPTENISETLVDVQSAATPAQQRPTNYVITDADELGEGGAKAKFRGNVAAIRLLRKLAEEKRAATREEQSVLAKWVGWGGLRNAFYREDGSVAKGWEKEAAELKALLDSTEYASAESSTRNAHYTSPEVVSAVWDVARRLGFKGGQVLEPSVGAGNFLGLMPGELRDGAAITGVELDHITGGIAKNLYPGANIQSPMGFEKLTVPNDYFDLAIGNPPFGSEKLYDKQRRHLNKLSIHNFFFAKAIEALRPGGVLAMVVTNRFLDGASAAARDQIAKTSDLVGAIRLPNNAFLKNAGTEVTTDIVILRKRLEGDKPDTSWTKVGEWKGKDGKAVPLNQYFIDKPEMMLGDFGAYGTMYGPDEPALVAREGEDLSEALGKAIRALPQNVMVEPGAAVVPETVNVPETVTDVQIGTAFLAPDGEVHVRMPDHLGQPVSQVLEYPNETAKARVQGMVRVRDAFAKLRRAQIDEKASDAQIENLRKRLNTLYDGFVAKHGPINADANKRLFRDDPTWPQISALEQGFDKGLSPAVAKKTGETAKAPSAQKAAIFTKRTQQPYSRVTSVSSAKDALAASLNDFGRINLDAMSFLYGKPAEAIVEELGPLVYKTPSGAYETADAYLSGNVKQKLAEAERAAEQDPAFRRNIAALRDVQPADIEAVDIDVKPGAPWVPAKHIEDFAMHITESGARGKAYYSKANAKWAVEVPRPSPAASTLYGTDRAGVETVLMAVLNGQSITIHDRFRDGSTAVNQEATEAANEKAARVKAEWDKWLWQDDARREELVRLYNDTFNTDVLRKYDGSHLTLPGKVSDDIIELRPHQKSFIWRRLQGGTALADHTVGAGKTFAAIASIMEKRRIGQARKPMLVVPNHLVGQWAADFVKLYPGAKVLAATKRDFEKENRKRLFARIATGDWDAVIVAHSSFGRIGMNPEYEARFIQEQMDDLEMSIAELRAETGQKSRNVAQLTKWRDNLKAKMERLLDAGKKDDGLTFDELGVDDLTVDEAHEFKNLAYSTSMQRVAGLGNAAGSQRAADLYMKTQFVLEKTGGNNVAFLTGTPLSNTMAEMYTVQRYLDRKSLTDLGIAHFDAWARVFGEVVTDWELSPSGQYKLNSRFAKFVNVPELMQRYLAFADVVTNDDIKAQMKAMGRTMPLPKVKGGKPTIVVVERSPDQAKYIGEATADDQGNMIYPEGSIVWRAENLPKKQEKGADNMLKVMSDARKAALDMRLVDPGYGDYRGSKVHKAADEMTRIYKKWADKRGTQLVFIDLSTPKKAMATEQAKLRDLISKAEEGDEAAQEALDKMSPDDFLALQSSFSVYDDLRQKLIDRGIPESEIAFIHDANTEAQKEELFGKVRSGKIRFLFGSTAKMGAGTNVQNRLVGLHHLDAPWRPSDLEQRDGRGIRQGNELYAEDPEGFEIEIMRYATENTLDARQWQTIEAKAKFIEQIRKGDLKKRDIEDIGGEAANAAEMKAAASGNPLILEEMETRRKLQQLERQSSEHDREQHRIKGRIRSLNEEAQSLRNRLPEVEADAQRAQAVEGKPFSATVKGEAFDKHKEFGAAVIAAIRKDLIERAGETEIGEYAGFKISIEHMHSRQYDITLAGDRDYHVSVEDAADMDPTGTAMRIVNTIKGLARIPAADKERIAEIERQAPALERQIAPWTGQQELDETAARHRRLVDALKPKPKGAAGQTTEVIADVAAETEPAKQNKRPDPAVEGAVGNLRSLGTPELKKGIPLRDAAIARVTADGRRTGHEYLLALDDDGSVVEYGTAGDKANTGMNNRLLAAMANPDRKVVVYHNHPSNGPLSSADIGFLAYPGLYSIWAAGHDGQVTRAALTVAAAEALSSETPDLAALSMAKLKNAMIGVEYALQGFLQAQLNSKAITVDQANEAHAAGKLMAADRANVIDFTTNTPYDAAAITGFDAVIDAAADKLAGEIFNGPKNTGKRADRRAEPLRHAAEVARAPVAGKPDAGRRSDTSGLAEASTADYQGKGRGREKRQRVTETRIVEDLRGKLTDLQPAILKTIPLNYFSELARPNMKAVGEYLRVKRIMDAFRGTKHAEADAIGQEWLKYTRLGFVGKDKAKAQALADLMHEATLSGIDPSKVDAETQAMPGYAALRKAYTALSPKGRELFNKVRDAYRQQTEELDEILLDNVRKAQEIALRQAEDRYRRTLQQIKDAGLTGIDKKNAEEDAASAYRAATTKGQWAAKARLTRMRIAFEASRVQGPYFPLGRFGRYFATVRDIDGKVLSFSKFETVADRDRAVRQMQKDYPNAKFEVGVMEAGSDLRRAMDPRIVAEIEELLGGSGVSPELMDQVWQRYLESMPDLSARKRFIHRKGTAGFTGDALRVFSSHMFHAAHQMARLKFGLELQELVNQTFDQAKEADDQTRAMTLANELSKRHDWVMNPTGSKVAQTMTSTAFVWFLAASPASAMVNMSQTVMLGLPILGARFGGILKAGKALAQASRDSVAGRGSVARANLKEDEKRAIEAFYESGLIDRTQSHDLAGVGETGVEYSPLRAKVMGVISWAFHRAEVWNREVTALAAYRMARAAGQNQSDAIDTAHDLTWKTHFDYSNSSRPALLQNDFAKVALVFRQHNINMLYRMFRDIHQAVKGETPAARREARYQVAGITGMMALMSGVSGVMGYSLAMALAGMILGDDDDPMAFEQQFRANIVDILGPELGGIVLNGAPGHYLGIDLTSRIGMPDLWFRSPSRELQGKDEYQYWLSQSLGATVSLGEQLYRGFNVITDEGDVARGLEMMAPKAVRDLMKAYRYADEGVTSLRGDEIVPQDEIGIPSIIAQALGFTPAEVAETWERNSALKDAESRIKQKRQRLITRFAMAALAKDKETMSEAIEDIKRFNAVKINAPVAITKETLQRSIKTRASISAKRQDGVLISNEALGKELRDRLADPIYR